MPRMKIGRCREDWSSNKKSEGIVQNEFALDLHWERLVACKILLGQTHLNSCPCPYIPKDVLRKPHITIWTTWRCLDVCLILWWCLHIKLSFLHCLCFHILGSKYAATMGRMGHTRQPDPISGILFWGKWGSKCTKDMRLYETPKYIALCVAHSWGLRLRGPNRSIWCKLSRTIKFYSRVAFTHNLGLVLRGMS